MVIVAMKAERLQVIAEISTNRLPIFSRARPESKHVYITPKQSENIFSRAFEIDPYLALLAKNKTA